MVRARARASSFIQVSTTSPVSSNPMALRVKPTLGVHVLEEIADSISSRGTRERRNRHEYLLQISIAKLLLAFTVILSRSEQATRFCRLVDPELLPSTAYSTVICSSGRLYNCSVVHSLLLVTQG